MFYFIMIRMFMFNTKGFVMKDIKKETKPTKVKESKVMGCDPKDVIQFYDENKNPTDQISKYATCKTQESMDSSGYIVTTNSVFDEKSKYKILDTHKNAPLSEFENFCKETCNHESRCLGFSFYKESGKYKCALTETLRKEPYIVYGSGSDFRTFEKVKEEEVKNTKKDIVLHECEANAKQDSCFVTSSNGVRYNSHKNKQLVRNKNETIVLSNNESGCAELCDSDKQCRGFSVNKDEKQCEYIIHDYHDFTSNQNNPEMIDKNFSVAFTKQTHLL